MYNFPFPPSYVRAGTLTSTPQHLEQTLVLDDGDDDDDDDSGSGDS